MSMWSRKLVVLVWIHCVAATLRGPPRIIERHVKLLQAVKKGQELRTICPIEGATIVEWYKDGEPITSAWSRFRVSARTLRIRTAHSEDGGIYECKGVNGFGSQITRMRLVVLDDEINEGDNGNGEAHQVSREDLLSVPSSSFSVPVLSVETREQSGPMHLSSGNTIRFRCEAKGMPTPRLTWLKDGKPVGEKIWRTSSWTLVLDRLTTEDAGVYTCSANNSVGHVESAIHLHVTDLIEKRRPELASDYPNNTSVLIGNEAVLECVVFSGFSSMPPHIKWLKRVPDDHKRKAQTGRYKHRLLPVENQHVLVIQETHDEAIHINETQLNGTFVSRLIFSRTSSEDEGVYICLATNNVGYTYKEARLTVLAEAEILSSSSSVIPFPLIVIGMSLGIALLVIGAACALRRHQDSQPKQTKSMKPRKLSTQSINSSTYQNHGYEQRQLLVSTTTSTNSMSSSNMICKSNHLVSEPTIEIAMSQCSCCDRHSSEISPIPTYEHCCTKSFTRSTAHSLQCGHWT